MRTYFHHTLDAALAIDRARDPNWLTSQSKRRISSDFRRDLRTRLADFGKITTNGWLRQLTVTMAPLLSILGQTTGADFDAWGPKIQHKMRAHGLDIVVVEMSRAPPESQRHRQPWPCRHLRQFLARQKRQSGRHGIGRFGDKFFYQWGVSEKEGRARRMRLAALFRDLPDRHRSVALAERNVREDCDRGTVGAQY